MSDPATSAPEQTPAQQTSRMRTYATDVAALTGIPLQKNVRNEPAPPPKPKNLSGLPPAHIIPKAPQTNETKAHVLTRLQDIPEAPSAPAPKVPEAAPAVAVVFPQEKPLPHIPTLTKPEIAPSPTASRIHTYKSDFSKRTESAGISRIGMLAAEQDAAGTKVTVVLPEKKKNNLLLVTASVLLIVAGGASVYGAYLFATGESTIPAEVVVPSLVFPDERIKIEGSGSELREKLSTLTSETLDERDIAIVYMTYSTTTMEGTKAKTVERVASGSALFEALRLPAPAILLRNIEPESTMGIVKTAGRTHPFFILRVASYDRTFAGMLAWEPTLEHDLLLFYPPYNTPEMGTSTPSISESFRLSFVDEVIENRDVRVLRDQDNHIIMLYGYRDKETLIIARDFEAFSEIVGRLAITRGQ